MSIDINGQEYELSSYGEPHSDGSRAATIRLVKAEPKWHLELEEHNVGHDLVLELTDTSKDQAQLIKDCCEKMMKSLFSEQIEGPDLDTVIAMNKARHSIIKGDK